MGKGGPLRINQDGILKKCSSKAGKKKKEKRIKQTKRNPKPIFIQFLQQRRLATEELRKQQTSRVKNTGSRSRLMLKPRHYHLLAVGSWQGNNLSELQYPHL